MTTYPKRRGRRSLAAILAAMLMASVLAVVAGSPAHAANTASQVLVDHDNNAKTPKVRQFAGATRYETALALARDFAEKNGGIDGFPTAFVASGESLIDAVAVSALAGDMNAPVLLTPSDELHRGVADFLENYGVDNVYVLGGSAAVADSVLTALETLVHKPEVKRIAGDDRYETATAIASMLTGSRSWCNSSEETAVLVNGGDSSLAGATVIGPLANRLAVPVLLTAADELPDVTREWIDDNVIDHVVIVGSTDDVSAGIASTLSSDGVDTVERVEGDTPAELSVSVAELATGDCKADLSPVAGDKAALVNGWGRDISPDAITASPVLSNGSLIPILLVGDTLPESVSEYLKETPAAVNGTKVNYQLLAIGGVNAVSESVMAAAISAASSADAFSVQITNNVDSKTADNYGAAPQAGDTTFTLRFSDRVARAASDADTVLTGQLQDIVEINGVLATFTIGSEGTSETDSSYSCDSATVRINLGSGNALKAGDRISIAGGSSLMIGAGGDKRTLAPTEVSVAAKPVDNTGPKISIVGVEDNTDDGDVGTVQLTVTSEAGSALGTGAAATIVADVAGTDDDNTREIWVVREGSATEVLPSADVAVSLTDNTFTTTLTLAGNAEWKAGDRIVVRRGALADASKNKSPQANATVEAARATPKATAVYVSEESHTANATMSIASALTGGTADEIKITSKKDGPAGGVHGNDWTVRVRTSSSWKPTGDANISVGLDTKRKHVVATINGGTPTYGELKAALDSEPQFSARFEVELAKTTATNTVCAKPKSDTKLVLATTGVAGTDTLLTGGVTRVAVEVRFDGYLATLTGNALRDDVMAAATERSSATLVGALDISTSPATFAAPSKTVLYHIVADEREAAALPMPGIGNDLVSIAAATVATGYERNDAATTTVDENGNGKADRWMTRSSTLKPPAAPAG